jgi:hypothetical protein
MLACDFLTVETAFLQRIYVLFFISLATRRIEYIACTPNSDGRWVGQQARNLVMRLSEEQPFRFLVHDRDAKFSHAFDWHKSVIGSPVRLGSDSRSTLSSCIDTTLRATLAWPHSSQPWVGRLSWRSAVFQISPKVSDVAGTKWLISVQSQQTDGAECAPVARRSAPSLGGL